MQQRYTGGCFFRDGRSDKFEFSGLNDELNLCIVRFGEMPEGEKLKLSSVDLIQAGGLNCPGCRSPEPGRCERTE